MRALKRPMKSGRSECRVVARCVLNALGNQPMLVSILENAEWTLEGNSLTAKVAASSAMIEMSFTGEARRIASAPPVGGRETDQDTGRSRWSAGGSAPRRAASANGSARSRAEQDPIVQRMKEKFGAKSAP